MVCARHMGSLVYLWRGGVRVSIAQWPMPVPVGVVYRCLSRDQSATSISVCRYTHATRGLRRGPAKHHRSTIDGLPVSSSSCGSSCGERPSIDRRQHLSHGALARHALDGFARAPRLRPSLPLITPWTVTSCRRSMFMSMFHAHHTHAMSSVEGLRSSPRARHERRTLCAAREMRAHTNSHDSRHPTRMHATHSPPARHAARTMPVHLPQHSARDASPCAATSLSQVQNSEAGITTLGGRRRGGARTSAAAPKLWGLTRCPQHPGAARRLLSAWSRHRALSAPRRTPHCPRCLGRGYGLRVSSASPHRRLAPHTPPLRTGSLAQ